MGYMHIENLYKIQEIMEFRTCYALEKIHGTSAHISWNVTEVKFFAGGESHEKFAKLFDVENLKAKMNGISKAIVYGEAYGGKCQGMSATYGKELKFVAFDVQIDGMWLSVPQAADFTQSLGLEFVDYVKIPTEIDAINAERDRPSTQAIRNGMGDNHKREGVVLRPPFEVTKNNGNRIIVKHKRDEFRETATPRVIEDPEKLKVLEDANAIAVEWVTPMRVAHVLDKMEDPSMENMREIMARMSEDIQREGAGEIVWSKEVERAIGKATAQAVKNHLQAKLQMA